MNEWCFRPRFCTVLGRRQPERMRWIFVMNHAPGAGLINQPVGQQSSALPLYHGCLPILVTSPTYCYRHISKKCPCAKYEQRYCFHIIRISSQLTDIPNNVSVVYHRDTFHCIQGESLWHIFLAIPGEFHICLHINMYTNQTSVIFTSTIYQ